MVLCVIAWQYFTGHSDFASVESFLRFVLLPFVPALLIPMLKLEPPKTAFGRRLTLLVWKVSWVLSGIVATLIALAVAYFGWQYFGGLLEDLSLRVWVAVIAIVLVVSLVAATRCSSRRRHS